MNKVIGYYRYNFSIEMDQTGGLHYLEHETQQPASSTVKMVTHFVQQIMS